MAAGASMIFAVLRPLVNKAATIVVDRLDGIQRDISKLQTILFQIESILQEAEEKQIDDAYIQKWLNELVDISYEVRDVVDDFITYSVARETRASRSVRFNSLPYSSFFLRDFDVGGSLPFRLRFRLAKDIKGVMVRFDEKVKESKKFTTLKSVVGGGGSGSIPVYPRPETGHFLDKQSDLFVGRGDVKEGIMKKLLDYSDNCVHVVPILGMGGIGKTTLAKSIYNDERVKEEDYPSLNRRWLYVGEKKFNATEIITKIIKESDTNDVEDLQAKLMKKLRGNRFLIVLDDAWDVDGSEWKKLWEPLTNVGKGGFIIITTRIENVVTATNTQVLEYRLSPLSEKDSWLIFESHAFIDGKPDYISDLKPIGQQIVQKLKGLPLALEVVGRSLLNKPDAIIWTNFLTYKEWMLKKNNDDVILPALRWSYNCLPSHLKQCFAYCTLFPKDHVYDEKVLVEMWMAHGFIQNAGEFDQRREEDIGAQYFRELLYASLFQCVDNGYMMHDMIHDLALLVSNDEFASANDSLLIGQMEKVRHITITPDDYWMILELCKSKRILTLYTISSQQNCEQNTSNFDKIFLLRVFGQLKSIRVLVLSHEEITEIPDYIGKLKHLRYFDISQTMVKRLPDSLCDLHNLQTLAAPLDATLPRNIVNMANLRHLRANITTYEGIAKLTSLQELSSITCKDGYISELEHFRELRGKLEIHDLENVTRPEDAAKAFMQDKTHIYELTLVFKVDLGNVVIPTKVLDALQCPPNLTSLTIDGYSGNKFPNWMTSGNHVVNLQRLRLYKCHQLKFLSPLGELKSLKHLDLKSMHGVEQLGDELYGKGKNGKMFFPSLISISLSDMKNLKEWDSTHVFFPSLESLKISQCPKLVSIILSPLNCITADQQDASTIKKISISDCNRLRHIGCERLPSLTDLSVTRCYQIKVISHLVRIERLHLNDCEKLRSLTIGRQGLESLNELDIQKCPFLESIYEEGSTSSSSSSSSALSLSNLQDIITDNNDIFTKLFNHEVVSIASIFIDGFNGVECFGEIVQNKWHNLYLLVDLFIDKCKDLKSLSPEFRYLPKLKVLQIYSCPKLESLPADGLPLSIESLKIRGCPLLFERCKEECGSDWDKIKHISHREILLTDPYYDIEDQGMLMITYEASMISATVRPMVDKAAAMVDKAAAMVVDRFDEMVHIKREISNLQSTLSTIEGIVQEAEQKQIDNAYLQNWLHDLVDIGYETRDVLDDFITFYSSITAERSSESVNFSASLSYYNPWRYFDVGGSSSDPLIELPLTLQNKLANDIMRVRERFDEKIKESKTFTILKSVEGGSESVRIYCRPEVGPYLNQQRDNLFLGREDVKEGIMKKLLHPSDNRVHVIPIWGMGGIGKTTLAQSIYNDERVKDEDYPSKNRRWLCVGNKMRYDAKEVIREIVNDSKTISIGNLQTKLKEKLRGNRFLIVLDDVWDINGNEWDLLFNPLTSVGKGGFIIITTRISEVFTAINTHMLEDLKPLSKEHSWSIFESRAYINGKSDSRPDLKVIGQKIVKKLKGLPLALEVVGCSLLNIEDASTWENFLTSKEWMLGKTNSVMPALKWSYNRLHPHLKMCFTYCSLFPKNHLFVENVLVEMWMAHDLIPKEMQKRPEDVGAQYFKELVHASLLQCVDGKYVMHDIIHDLALLVSNEEFASANDSHLIDQMEKVRHITITPDDYSKILNLHMSEKLLTLYTICCGEEDTTWCDDYGEEDTNCFNDSDLYDVFKQLKSIRVLVLSNNRISEIPKCISELRHLRYLDVSQTRVTNLPDSLCYLYNLQMLAAPLDAELPRDIVNIPSLRYVKANLSTCMGVGNLTFLQELSSISVCKEDNIKELGDMQQLRGKLTIKGLENVSSLEGAVGPLMDKQTLMDQLELVFDKDLRDATISAQVLNALGCPPNLTCLKIVGYNGIEPPSWIVDENLVAKLQTLELSDCPQLESLPPLGELTSLKHLSLQSLHGVKRLGDEFYGNFTKNKVFFPSLESLYFYDMEGWEEWDGIIIKNSRVSFFPCLTSLEIDHCPSISLLVLPPVKNCTSKWKQLLRYAANFMKSLSHLKICYCPELKRLQLDALVSLKDLDVDRCSSLVQITSATTIERLQILQCEHLETMDFKRLPSLEYLDIRSCPKLISIPCLVGITYLHKCESLKALIINIRGLDSLERLTILSCPVLELIFEEGSSSSSSSGNSVAVQLRIRTDNKQIFRKLLQHELISLESLHIEKLSGFENFGETEENNFCKLRSLKSLRMSECEDLKSLPTSFYKLSSLESLYIISCPQLQSLPPNFHKLSSLEILHIESCTQIQSLPPDFHRLSSLENLYIKSCTQLQSLPTDFHKLSSIEFLQEDCPKFLSLLSDFHKLSSLEYLKIEDCPKLQSLPANFHMLSSLEKLYIISCPQLQSLPSDFHKLSLLECLQIKGCLNLQSLPSDFHKLSSLEYLQIEDCPKLQSLPANFHMLSSLEKLYIKSCTRLQSLPPDFHKLSSLEILQIKSCTQLQSLPPDFHKLSSLKKLYIESCTQLQSLPPDFHKLSSLEKLYIESCTQLQSLPALGLPRSIESLVISECPLLCERCKRGSNLDWHKIKHIHEITLYLEGNSIRYVDVVENGDDDDAEEEEEEIFRDPGMRIITYGASMISTILRPIADKAKEIIEDKAEEFMVVDQVDGIANIKREISNLQITLSMIEVIVQEAEENQIDNDCIQNWLRDLVDIGYEARDVLDDFITSYSSIIAEGASKPVNFNTSLSYNKRLHYFEKDIRGVRERFDEKEEEGKTFTTSKFALGGGSKSVLINRRPEVGSFINQQGDYLFLGREEVKKEIMEKILHSNDNLVHIIPIWGMGGIGKTTLAQSIYNAKELKEEDYPSKNRKWVCVGDAKFNAEKVIVKILSNSSHMPKMGDDIDSLQKKLVEKLKGNRFLIVLDDIWDVDGSEWNLLFNPLTNVGKRGFIIITTRRSEVFTATNTLVPDKLRHLSEEHSWSIFESRAFKDGKSDSRPDLKGIGEKIVKKLNGLPLALEVVGCTLLNEDSSTWTDFLESNEWMSMDKDDGIMPTLRWCYNRLPPHLKICFSYFSLFPKDHVFVENVLVEMWMAHDLIKKEEQKRPEDVGAQYFKELVNASLLQCLDGKYMMHDMIHELALMVSNEEFFNVNANGSLLIDQMENVRHITITPDDYSNISSLRKSDKLLTLYTICSGKEDPERFDDYSEEDTNWIDNYDLYDVFKQLKSIRVLVLSSECIYEIPECISGLIHLRYLNISQTRVRNLPDSLCHLYNLQMLATPLDVELPGDIVNIPSLRYVRANLSTCKGVGKLTSLQELASIRVSKGDSIREFGNMQQLRGKLTIKGLENVSSLEDDVVAVMVKQKLMDQLELVFNQHVGESYVLDALGCPPNLTYLSIMGYDGLKPTRWMEDKKLPTNLQTLELSYWPHLMSLPPLGELKSLKHLSLKSLHGVKRLGKEFYGNLTESKQFFPSLESLYFDGMEGWKEWDDKFIIKNSDASFFPCLTSLEINHCPKLVLVLPTVNTAAIPKREDKHYFMKSLSRLKISYCDGLKRLQLDILVSLKDLDICHCNSLVLIKSEVEITTERLQISYCEHLEKMDFKRLSSVKHLDLRGCHKLVSIPCLVGIEFLYLTHCKSLTTLNVRGLDSLEYLLISDCPVLELIFEDGSSSLGNSEAVRLHICTDKKQIFTKLFQLKFLRLETLSIESVTEVENFCEREENKFCELESLKSLCISRCKDLKSLPANFHKLSSLNSLKIENCPKLQSLPANFPELASLQRLEIISCPQLQSLPQDFNKLSSLKSLCINVCPQLQSLPASGFPQDMDSLDILNCQLLYKRCKDEFGFDWHKIKHIPKLTIFGEHKVHRYCGDEM